MEKTVTISQKEYDQLKKYQRAAEKWRQYLHHARDIEQARRELAEGKGIPMEEVFKELGI